MSDFKLYLTPRGFLWRSEPARFIKRQAAGLRDLPGKAREVVAGRTEEERTVGMGCRTSWRVDSTLATCGVKIVFSEGKNAKFIKSCINGLVRSWTYFQFRPEKNDELFMLFDPAGINLTVPFSIDKETGKPKELLDLFSKFIDHPEFFKAEADKIAEFVGCAYGVLLSHEGSHDQTNNLILQLPEKLKRGLPVPKLAKIMAELMRWFLKESENGLLRLPNEDSVTPLENTYFKLFDKLWQEFGRNCLALPTAGFLAEAEIAHILLYLPKEEGIADIGHYEFSEESFQELGQIMPELKQFFPGLDVVFLNSYQHMVKTNVYWQFLDSDLDLEQIVLRARSRLEKKLGNIEMQTPHTKGPYR